jgi:TPR repeat protein
MDEAARWYRAAAEKGLAASQMALGLLYLRGEGVGRDNAEAWIWFDAARSRGHAGALEARKSAAEGLSDADLTRAKKLAAGRVAK